MHFHRASSPWLNVVPWGMRGSLCWLKERYSNPPVYITENGFSDNTGTTDDHDRVDYLRCYINEVLKGDILLSQAVILSLDVLKFQIWVTCYCENKSGIILSSVQFSNRLIMQRH